MDTEINTRNTKLNQKQLIFCTFILEGMSSRKAAIMAGFSEKSSHIQGSRLMKNVNVCRYLSEQKSKISELAVKKEAAKIASKEDVLEYLTKTMNNEDEKTADRNKASEMLAKHHNILNDQGNTVNNILITLPEELKHLCN